MMSANYKTPVELIRSEQGKVFIYQRLETLYDRIHASLPNKVASIKEEEWEHGMYYPTRLKS